MKRTALVLFVLVSMLCNTSVFAAGDFELPDIDTVSSNTGKTDIELYLYESDEPISIEMGNYDSGGPGTDSDGDLLVPLRLASAFLFEIENNGDEIQLSKDNDNIRIFVNDEYALVNDKKIEFKCRKVNDNIYFSYKYIPLLFNVSAEWNKDENKLILHENEYRKEEEEQATTDEDYNTINVYRQGDESSGYITEVYANGKYVDFGNDLPFTDKNGRVQVPVRYVAEMLDCVVNWNDEARTVTISTNYGKTIDIEIGNRTVITDDTQIEMDTEAEIVNDRTYVPIRYVAEALGMSVCFKWDNDQK
jgi:hypothetical protein